MDKNRILDFNLRSDVALYDVACTVPVTNRFVAILIFPVTFKFAAMFVFPVTFKFAVMFVLPVTFNSETYVGPPTSSLLPIKTSSLHKLEVNMFPGTYRLP